MNIEIIHETNLEIITMSIYKRQRDMHQVIFKLLQNLNTRQYHQYHHFVVIFLGAAYDCWFDQEPT